METTPLGLGLGVSGFEGQGLWVVGIRVGGLALWV